MPTPDTNSRQVGDLVRFDQVSARKPFESEVVRGPVRIQNAEVVVNG
ncbi:MAG: hypothetical protein WKF75_01365 [Singulisphaera sp.]